MLWLLSGTRPAQGGVGAGRADWRKHAPGGHTREQGLGPFWLSSALLTPATPGEGVLTGGRTYPNLSLSLIHPWEVMGVLCPGMWCAEEKHLGLCLSVPGWAGVRACPVRAQPAGYSGCPATHSILDAPDPGAPVKPVGKLRNTDSPHACNGLGDMLCVSSIVPSLL